MYQNKATNVCLLSEPYKTFLPSPLRSLTSLSRGLQGLGGVEGLGGGFWVEGVANFEGCNIHDNTASGVCLNFPELSSIAPLNWPLN